MSADFDQDGQADAAATAPNDSIFVLLGQGGGAFTVSTFAAGSEPRELVVGDIDGDGQQDLALSLHEVLAMGVHLGLGDGTFSDAGLYGAGSPYAPVAGDVDLDGRTDIVVSRYSQALVTMVNTAPSAWSKVGYALAGGNGVPILYGTGTLAGTSLNGFHLVGTAPSAPFGVFVGLSQALLPFKGGTLVPAATLLVLASTHPSGQTHFPFHMPPGAPAATTLVMQAWILDASGPKGFAASNGLLGVTP